MPFSKFGIKMKKISMITYRAAREPGKQDDLGLVKCKPSSVYNKDSRWKQMVSEANACDRYWRIQERCIFGLSE